jgi:hypothetical protein
MAQLLGIAYVRYVLQLEPIASVPADELVARVTPVINYHLGTSNGRSPRR